jgi:hypothetical protein
MVCMQFLQQVLAGMLLRTAACMPACVAAYGPAATRLRQVP